MYDFHSVVLSGCIKKVKKKIRINIKYIEIQQYHSYAQTQHYATRMQIKI